MVFLKKATYSLPMKSPELELQLYNYEYFEKDSCSNQSAARKTASTNHQRREEFLNSWDTFPAN
jgi:hypothetical protein